MGTCDHLLKECAQEIASLCAENQHLFEIKEGPYLCKIKNTWKTKHVLDLAHECLYDVQQFQRQVEVPHVVDHMQHQHQQDDGCRKGDELINELQDFSLELQEAMLSLPDDLQHEVPVKPFWSSSNKIRKEMHRKHIVPPPLNNNNHRIIKKAEEIKKVVKTPILSVEKKRKKRIIAPKVEPSPVKIPYAREKNPLLVSFQRLLQQEKKESEKIQNEVKETIFIYARQTSIQQHVSRQQTARHQKEVRISKNQKVAELDALPKRLRPTVRYPTTTCSYMH